ncbi:MAG: hypothetical protein Q9M20_04330 [Mariprofundaceae bacterium]|nr:hypothetical protein [Mariprofundaceae bacterium]
MRSNHIPIVTLFTLFLFFFLIGSTPIVAGEDAQQARELTTEQLFQGGYHMIMTQRMMLMEQFETSLEKIQPFLDDEKLSEMKSQGDLQPHILAATSIASVAHSLAFLSGNAYPSMIKMLRDNGSNIAEANQAVGRLVAHMDEFKKDRLYFAQYSNVMNATKDRWQYLQLHWGNWKVDGEKLVFSNGDLDAGYQQLNRRLAEEIAVLEEIPVE